MTPVTATAIPTTSALAIQDGSAPAPIAAYEVGSELDLTARAEKSFIDRISSMENAAVVFKRRTELIETCYLIAIRRTRPADWVLFKTADESVNAMLTASGAELVAEVYGVQIEGLRPLNAQGIFAPERIDYPSGAYALRGTCDAWSGINGRRIFNLEAVRRSDEDFTGRSVDVDGRLTHDKAKRAGALDSDLRSSVLTLLRTKAVRVLCGMTRVPTSDLEAAWKDSTKKLEQCRKGHGFGTADGRRASTVTEEGVPAEVEKLKAEVLRLVGGDTSAQAKLVKEITSSATFKGFDTLDRITKPFQVDQAWANLKKHPIFGNGKAQKPAEREPGAEG